MKLILAQTFALTFFSLQVHATQILESDSQKAAERLISAAVEFESEHLGLSDELDKLELRNLILQRIEIDGFENAITNKMNNLILNNQIIHNQSIKNDINTLAMSKMLPGGFDVEVKVDVKVKVPPQKEKKDKK